MQTDRSYGEGLDYQINFKCNKEMYDWYKKQTNGAKLMRSMALGQMVKKPRRITRVYPKGGTHETGLY